MVTALVPAVGTHARIVPSWLPKMKIAGDVFTTKLPLCRCRPCHPGCPGLEMTSAFGVPSAV